MGSIARNVHTATIANGASLSGVVQIGGNTLVGIGMPAAWTAAGLSFQISVNDGTTWLDLYDGSGEVTVTTADAGRFLIVPAGNFTAGMWIKVRSGTAGAPVAQGAERVLTLICRTMF